MKFRILLKSFNQDLIGLTSQQIYESLKKTDCTVKGVIKLPKKRKRFCVLRSPHIDKDSREHFEIILHKHLIDLSTTSPVVLENLLKLELPAGLSCSLKTINLD